MDTVYTILDNLESLVSGKTTIAELGLAIPLTNELLLSLHDGLQATGRNVQQVLPGVIRFFEPNISLPSKISNLIKKVRRKIDRAQKEGNEVEVLQSSIPVTYSEQGLSSDFKETNLTVEILKTCDFVEGRNYTVNKLEIRHILELRRVLVTQHLPWNFAMRWLKALLNSGEELNTTVSAVTRQWSLLHYKYIKTQKNGGDVDSFLSETYKLPVSKVAGGRVHVARERSLATNTHEGQGSSSVELESTLENLTRTTNNLIDSYKEISMLSEAMEEVAIEKLEALEKLKELDRLKQKYNKKNNDIRQLKEKLASLTPRNMTKKLKRRDEKISKMEHQIIEQDKVIDDQAHQINLITKEAEKLQVKLDQILKEKTNLQKNKSYWKMKSKSADKEDSILLRDARHHISQIENENQELHEKITQMMSDNQIKTFENGKYTDTIRQIYYDLLSHNVSVDNCTSVVKAVIKNLLNIDVERLPSKSLTSMLQVEALVLAQAHAATTILEQNNPNTLHSDGTRKKFVDYAGFQVSLGNTCTGRSSLSLGFQELLRGSADDYLQATLATFMELSESITENDEEKHKIYAQLLLKSKNLMSDRHVVNKKYKSKLEEVRETLLPVIETNWDNFDENEKVKMKTINHLLCGMHILVNMASAASSSCKEFENENKDQINILKAKTNNYKSSQSLCFDLLYQAGKGFTEEGCQKSGVYTDFYPYMEDVLKEKNQLLKFEHNRFNVAFHQGGAVYYHKDHISDFLNSGRIDSTNKLISHIQAVLKEPVVIAECRALGIISKLITGPLMRLLEQNINYFDMNVHWLELKTCLADNSIDATPLLNEKTYISNSSLSKDNVYRTLFEKSTPELDTLTLDALKHICTAMLPVIQRQLSNQLPGGDDINPTECKRKEVESAPLTNVRAETDFSDLDRHIKKAPQKSRVSKAGCICYSRNKSSSYFNNLRKDIKEKYLKIARKIAPERKKKAFVHSKLLRERRLVLQREKMNRKHKQLQRKLEMKEQLKRRIETKWGVWLTEAKVDDMVSQLKKGMQLQAVKDQINYRVNTLHFNLPNKKLAKWQNNKIKLTVQELADNLKLIIRQDDRGIPEHVKEINENLKKRKATTQGGQTKRRKTAQQTNIQFGSCKVHAGMHVAVAYEENWYIGEIIDTDNEIKTVDILFFERKGPNSFQWPARQDRDKIDPKFILMEATIAPKDSLLRAWKVNKVDEIEMAYRIFKARYF